MTTPTDTDRILEAIDNLVAVAIIIIGLQIGTILIIVTVVGMR